MLLLVKDIEEMLFERLGPKRDQIKSMCQKFWRVAAEAHARQGSQTLVHVFPCRRPDGKLSDAQHGCMWWSCVLRPRWCTAKAPMPSLKSFCHS